MSKNKTGITEADLRPGDVLLYRPNSFVGWWIAVKTWHQVSHVETYLGAGQSAASRDGIGVDTYPLRWAGLRYVLRPNQPFDFNKALLWHESVRGQKYDLKGLLVFYLAVKESSKTKMFCSEHATRLARAGEMEPFTYHRDADTVAPATFLYSGAYDKRFEFL